MRFVCIGLLAFAMAAVAQDGPGFEVVSIKPSDSSAAGMRIAIDPGGAFHATNVTLFVLIKQAYEPEVERGISDSQIVGGPSWINTQRYDIIAKGSGPGVSEADLIKMTDEQRQDFQRQMQGKLRAMLIERFQLRVHADTRELPVYALVVAKGGARLQSTNGMSEQTGLKTSRNNAGKTVMTGTQAPLAFLVRQLSVQAGRPVIDKTGLKGTYSFKMVFAPDLNDPEGPSIFTAIEEQLGLKLDSQKAPMDVVVIDRAEKASEN